MSRSSSLQTPAIFAILGLVCALSACAAPSAGGGIQTAPQTVRQPVTQPPRSATIHMVPGLEGVIGVDANQLTRQFGPARLDVHEGDARKLQFSGTPCVLDVYLYRVGGRDEPIATYVDARRRTDGQDVDKVACANALKRR